MSSALLMVVPRSRAAGYRGTRAFVDRIAELALQNRAVDSRALFGRRWSTGNFIRQEDTLADLELVRIRHIGIELRDFR